MRRTHTEPTTSTRSLAPLLRHLEEGKAVTEPTVFPRGTHLPDGRLDLCKQSLGIEGTVDVARALRSHRFVSSVLLGADEIRNEGARAISKLMGENENVTTVFLGCNLIDREGASFLAAGVAGHATLRGLWVKRNPLGFSGVRALAEAMKTARALRTVDLAQVALEGAGPVVVEALVGHPSARRVYLSGNALHADAAGWLGELATSMRAFFASANHLGDAGVVALCGPLRASALESLSLAANGIGDAGFRALADALAGHRTLRTLALGGSPSAAVLGAPDNRCDDVASICALVRDLPALEDLELPALSTAMQRTVLDAVEARNTPIRVQMGNVVDAVVRARLRAAAEGVPRRVDEDVRAIASVYREGKQHRPPPPVIERPPPSLPAPTSDELERCAETLRALRMHPELATSKVAAPLAVRAEANRLIAAMQTHLRDSKRARGRDQSTRAKAHRRAHDDAVLEATTIRTERDPQHSAPIVTDRTLMKPRVCYVCKTDFTLVDVHYDSMCPACATENRDKRIQRANLTGRRAIVTGGRVKIGYLIALSLVRAGADVIVTTRFPCDAAQRFAREPDFSAFSSRLAIHGLDLRDLAAVERFTDHVTRERSDVDILINNAAQTVRRPPAFYRHLLEAELAGPDALSPEVARVVARTQHHAHAQLSQAHLLPGDADDRDFIRGELDLHGQQIDRRLVNSWALVLGEVDRRELLEVHHVNAFAPFVLVSRLLPHMLASPHAARFVVNVSAMEGKFDYGPKRPNHPHTNMAKAALNMLTRTSGPTLAQLGVYMTSVDTGWITNEQPLQVAERMRDEHGFVLPLTESDGAARVLDPVLCAVNGAPPQHSVFLKDYRVTSW